MGMSFDQHGDQSQQLAEGSHCHNVEAVTIQVDDRELAGHLKQVLAKPLRFRLRSP